MHANTVLLVAALVLIAVLAFTMFKQKNADTSTPCEACEIVQLPSAALTGGSAGAKRAVLIGCNYKFLGSACLRFGCTLNGCIEDVKNIRTLLETHGYQVTLLVDDGTTPMPNTPKILESLQAMIGAMQPGDTSFVWYSGHGSQIANASSDGGFDECWCPPDTILNGNYLTDNTLSNIFRAAPRESTVFVGSDSCHSATILDLKYIVADTNSANANRSMEKIRGRLPLSSFSRVASAPVRPRVLPPEKKSQALMVVADSSYQASEATIVCLSGCQDFDTSTDAFEDGQPQGAMTWAFLASFHPSKTFADLLQSMRTTLRLNGYSQVPQLTLGKLFNPNLTTLSLLT